MYFKCSTKNLKLIKYIKKNPKESPKKNWLGLIDPDQR